MKTGENRRPDLPLAVVIGVGGMGMAIARRLGERHRLLLADRDADRLHRQMSALRDEGHDARSVLCDITHPTSVTELAASVAAQGGLRVLAHVAGLSPSMADGATLMRVNLIGATLMERAMLPLARQGTAAIFIASLAAHMSPPAAEILNVLEHPLEPDFLESLARAIGADLSPILAYQFSKTALVRLCERQAAAWGKAGARIVSLSPGLIATPMGTLEFERQPMKRDLLAKTPLGREGTVPEIADAVDFLASDRASFISNIGVDGGIGAALGHGG